MCRPETCLLCTTAIVDDLDDDSAIGFDGLFRKLFECIGDQPGGLRVGPEVGGEEDLVFGAGYRIGHVAADVWHRCHDGQWAHAIATQQRGRAYPDQWIFLQRAQDIVIYLVVWVSEFSHQGCGGVSSYTLKNKSLGLVLPHFPHWKACSRSSAASFDVSTFLVTF